MNRPRLHLYMQEPGMTQIDKTAEQPSNRRLNAMQNWRAIKVDSRQDRPSKEIHTDTNHRSREATVFLPCLPSAECPRHCPRGPIMYKILPKITDKLDSSTIEKPVAHQMSSVTQLIQAKLTHELYRLRRPPPPPPPPLRLRRSSRASMLSTRER